MKGFSSDAKLLNGYLETLKNKAHTLERELMRDGKEVNFESFKEKWIGVPYKKHMIIKVFRQHKDEVAMLVGKEFFPTTLKRYKTSLSHTQNFIFWKFKKKDIEVSKLNYEFISNYSLWLKTVRNCNQNSAMKYLGNFKKIVQICLKNG